MKRFLTLTLGLLACAGISLAAIADAPLSAEAVTMYALNDLGGIDAMPFLGGAGLIINKDTLDGLSRNIKTSFQKAFEGVTGTWQETTMLVPSTGSENDYKWLTGWKGMKKWVGDKVINSLKAFNYVVANDDYEDTIEVDRNDIEDGNLGGYSVQAAATGESAALLYDDLDAEVKNGAFTNPCYDKQFFYDTDHPVEDENGDAVSVSNKGTAVLSNATLALASASYGVARQAIMGFTRDGGKKLGLVPNVLEVPPALESVGRMLLENEKLADGKPNPYRGTAKLKVNPLLTSTTAWFLHVTNKQVKPFVIQERKKPVFVAMTSSDSESVFMRKMFLYSVEARAAGAYGLWQLSYGSDGTA